MQLPAVFFFFTTKSPQDQVIKQHHAHRLHLSQMSARAAESHKHRKLDRENERRRRFLRKQREEEDFWGEYEELRSEFSSDESHFEDSTPDEPSSEEDNPEGVTDGGIILVKVWEIMIEG